MKQNPEFLAPKQNIMKEKLNMNKQKYEAGYHGSWGIPKYSK